jgi:hypothetical protein
MKIESKHEQGVVIPCNPCSVGATPLWLPLLSGQVREPAPSWSTEMVNRDGNENVRSILEKE